MWKIVLKNHPIFIPGKINKSKYQLIIHLLK